MQKCKVCGTDKPETEFYSNDKTCKECRKAKIRAYREENIEKIREYDRERGKDPERRAANKKRYEKQMLTEEGRKKQSEYKKASDERNTVKRAARIAVGNALRDGILERESCSVCGNPDTKGHHENYFKPLDVIWLCDKHHGERHKEINEEIRKGVDWVEKGWL